MKYRCFEEEFLKNKPPDRKCAAGGFVLRDWFNYYL